VTDAQAHPEDPAPNANEKDAATKKDGGSEADHKRPDGAPTDPEKARTVHGDEETVV
jgi:hypothetical protein